MIAILYTILNLTPFHRCYKLDMTGVWKLETKTRVEGLHAGYILSCRIVLAITVLMKNLDLGSSH